MPLAQFDGRGGGTLKVGFQPLVVISPTTLDGGDMENICRAKNHWK